MINNLIYTLDTPDRTAFGNAIRSFFSWIITAVYNFIGDAVDLMYRLAAHDYGLTDYIDQVGKSIFNVLIIFMLFKLTISIMTYLVNPEAFYDKNKGFSGIIKRVIISVTLLVSINPIFTILYDVQEKIVSEDVITTIFSSQEDQTTMYYGDKKVPVYGIKMSPYCNEDLKVYTFSKGDRLALLLFQPFFQPYSREKIANTTAFDHVMNNEESYCGINIESGNYDSIKIISGIRSYKESLKDQIAGPNSVDGLMQAKYYNLSVGEAERDDSSSWGYDDVDGHGTGGGYFIHFNFIIGTIAGILCLLIVVSFCFDVVIRSFTIIVLQIAAPVPIISYISPGKSSEMLPKWGKKLMTTWVSLFVRIAALSMAISFINLACKNLLGSMSEETLIFQIFVILGLLMFAKQLPKLLEELFPGLKMGGMELNPFKRVKKEALGGETLSNVTSKAKGTALGAIGGAYAGRRAGHEVGRPTRGMLLGGFEGAIYGGKNPKGAFMGSAANAYKTLSGNEFKRFDPMKPIANALTPNDEKDIAEVKGALDVLRKKKNGLEQKLAEYSHAAVSSSESLRAKGYDLNNLPTFDEKQSKDIITKGQTAISQKQIINSKIEEKKIEMQNDVQEYNAAQEFIRNNNRYVVGANGKEIIGANGQPIENKEYTKMKTIVDNYKQTLDNKTRELESLNNLMKTFDSDINRYNTYKEINQYQTANKETFNVRQEISKVDKQIDTMGSEKSQREQFYQVDKSPKKDVDKILDDYHNGTL